MTLTRSRDRGSSMAKNVKDKLSSVVTDPNALQQVKHLTNVSSELVRNQQTFDRFATKLVDFLEKTYSESSTRNRSLSVQTKEFGKVSMISKLVDLWKQLLTSLKVELDPLVQQYVNEELYEDILKS